MAPAGDDGDGLSVTALSGADDGEPRFDGGGAQDFAALGILGEVRDDGGQRHGPCAQVDAGVGVGLKEFGDEEHDDVVGVGAGPGLLEHPGQRRRLPQDLLLLGCGGGVRAHGVLLDGMYSGHEKCELGVVACW